ncbi:exosortase H-associated membrane protein [Thiothrix subterranea]|uniref:Exosortase H-associated membrane protein n=1 Tax=Thiothrix subterranea TaxID=2735563 RepID=A0AA51R366_9GAMM|nr:exosortase H-associated membrane protein [Thiothrix subterranea]MDQ5767985.1 exosortase H-associated membrane protein [Thiothrix subterranea]WML85250.1 exosortase H-associated membrane protein [Thiothrix subterranea]
MTHKPLHRFMLGVLIFFPLTFFLWYISATYHLAPITLITGKLVSIVVPDALMWLRLDGHMLVLASNFGHDSTGMIVSPPVGDDVLGFHLNPLIYSYSLPLLAALILATPSARKWSNLLWGIVLILPTEIFSMTFSVLKTLTFDVGAAFQAQQSISSTEADFIALGYQVGTLLLPMIAPLIIWVALNRDFLLHLAPQWEQSFTR